MTLSSSAPRRGALLCLLVAAFVAGPAPLPAQDDVLRGEVRLLDAPLTDATVVLHSVSATEAGEVDSVRVDARGRFSFTLPDALDDAQRNQIYFASVRYQDVLYFGEAVATRAQLDDVYRIETWDTFSAPEEGAEIPIAVRNVVMEESEDGRWLVTDLIQLRNPGDRTIVAGDGVVWSHALPASALEIRVGQGDLSADAIELREGRVVVLAPIPPGERIVMVRYAFAELPAEIPVESFTDRFDILVEEPASALEAKPLSSLGPVSVEGTTYRLYSAEGVAPTTVSLELLEEVGELPVAWLAVVFGLVLTGAGLFVYYRPTARPAPEGGPAAPAPGVGPTVMTATTRMGSGDGNRRRGLVLEVARIDEALDGAPDPDEEARLRERRAELMDRLRSFR